MKLPMADNSKKFERFMRIKRSIDPTKFTEGIQIEDRVNETELKIQIKKMSMQ
jgi:hypothetical protein